MPEKDTMQRRNSGLLGRAVAIESLGIASRL